MNEKMATSCGSLLEQLSTIEPKTINQITFLDGVLKGFTMEADYYDKLAVGCIQEFIDESLELSDMTHKMILFSEIVRRDGEGTKPHDSYNKIISILKENMGNEEEDKTDTDAFHMVYDLLQAIENAAPIGADYMKEVMKIIDKITLWGAFLVLLCENNDPS
jgi:hypothetical protein